MDDFYITAMFWMMVGICVSIIFMCYGLKKMEGEQEAISRELYQYHLEMIKTLHNLDKRQAVTETRLEERMEPEDVWEYQFAEASVPIDATPVKRKRGRPPKIETKNPQRGTEGQE
jgi:hypothetical protein